MNVARVSVVRVVRIVSFMVSVWFGDGVLFWFGLVWWLFLVAGFKMGG